MPSGFKHATSCWQAVQQQSPPNSMVHPLRMTTVFQQSTPAHFKTLSIRQAAILLQLPPLLIQPPHGLSLAPVFWPIVHCHQQASLRSLQACRTFTMTIKQCQRSLCSQSRLLTPSYTGPIPHHLQSLAVFCILNTGFLVLMSLLWMPELVSPTPTSQLLILHTRGKQSL